MATEQRLTIKHATFNPDHGEYEYPKEDLVTNPYGDISDWTANAIPRSRLEPKIFRAMHYFLTHNPDYEYYIERMSYEGSDEQWVIVCNMLALAQHPDNFEGYLE